MKILITGGAGFIGSTVAKAYIKAGHKVVILDNESTGFRSNVPKGAKYHKIDVCDLKKLTRLFKKERFDVVNHHAAHLDVRKSVLDPAFDAKINILGLLNLLTLAKDRKVKKMIFSSSGGTIYGECPKPASEKSPEIPLSPYGVSKLSSEKYIKAFSALHGLSYTILRYANVYGPKQDPFGEAGVVAIYCNRLLPGKAGIVFGGGKQTRDFVFSEDVARANVLALRKGKNRIFNIGTGKSTSVLQLYKTMSKLTGNQSPPMFKKVRAGELKNSCLNISAARTGLGWKPKVTLEQGLAKTIRYFEENYSRSR